MVEEVEPQERTIRLDRERCIGCYECIDVCPQSANIEFPVYVRGEDGFPRIANPDSCIGCLSCELNCRACAIRVDDGDGRERTSFKEVKAEGKRRSIF